MSNGFQRTLDQIRNDSRTEVEKGQRFENLMKLYFERNPLYEGRFVRIQHYTEWARSQPDLPGHDTGIDLVAEERSGGWCAIQCKCYSKSTRISKKHIDSFLSASGRQLFTSRIFVDTGAAWGSNARNAIKGLDPVCQLITSDDLAGASFDWPDLSREKLENLQPRLERFELRPHQRKAFNDILDGFAEHDRGKLIMACGTGKTFLALRVAEDIAKVGGRVLYLVPSIALIQQIMREWAEQKTIDQSWVGVCSDTRAGRNDEDAILEELEIPVTTDPDAIAQALQTNAPDKMKAVFCTYQSLDLIQKAQDLDAPEFDLVICDEAHRTTGIEGTDDEKTSPFVLAHDNERIRARKRLYMTATPRIYGEGAKKKAAERDTEVFSMDDPATYGPEFHRLPFSKSVEQELLSDFKVVVLAISEACVESTLQAHLATSSGEIDLTDTAKIVGCWQALQNPENRNPADGPIRPLKRVIAFTNTIKASKLLQKNWENIVERATEQLPRKKQESALRCRIRHIDGRDNALERKRRIEWLKEQPGEKCRILTNARCLSEGVDVPALDAVIFAHPRTSHVDIVQAVGRVMRKAKDKEYGYIVLPVIVPAGADPDKVLDDNERFGAVWSVLNALRSHDERFNTEINQLDLNNQKTDRIIFSKIGQTDESGDKWPTEFQLPFQLEGLPPDALYAKIVEKCGDRKYWESWAKDVADIFLRLISRIEALLASSENETLREWFDAFHNELKASINNSVKEEDAVEMMAQHIITKPVFDALFKNYDFAGGNPVAKTLDSLRSDFGEFGLENEIASMEDFYESVRQRAQGLDNPAARQTVLMELYEKFFKNAIPKDARRLGIVYTPVEIIDFLINSADEILRNEFNVTLSDEGVHVMEPFVGTGTVPARLLQSDLIRTADLQRKYREELHANEIVLLAYYIAAVHIEEAYRGRMGHNHPHEPFEGIVFTDTFNLHSDRTGFPKEWLPDNSKRVERQQKLPIQVIIGNPPYSARQKSATDDNANVSYPELEERIRGTYAKETPSTVKNKQSLYDSYKMAIRWASDRIGCRKEDQGVIAFVTNGSWIDSNADGGIRARFAKEFDSIYVLNLRGNQRTQGERSRREGGKVFGQGSRAPVAITILVKNPDARHEGCRILYHDIGDYLSREEKLSIVRKAGSVSGIKGWTEITPNQQHEWINQRNQSFQGLYPVGPEKSKAEKGEETIFELRSNGYYTKRDQYIYNFSYKDCAKNAQRAIQDYMSALEMMETLERDRVREATNANSSNLHWDGDLERNLLAKKRISYSENKIKKTQYRPFVKQYCYTDYTLAARKHQIDKMFPLAPPPPRGREAEHCNLHARQGYKLSVLCASCRPDA